MNVEIARFAYLSDVTLGRLTVGPLHLVTLEEPWRPDLDGPGGQRREGALMESCVPDGVFTLYPHNGTKFKQVWCLENRRLGVYRSEADIPAGQPWGRSSIVMHPGEDVRHTLGCILVGISHVRAGGTYSLTNTATAIDRLRAVLGISARHTLTIRPVAGTAEIAA